MLPKRQKLVLAAISVVVVIILAILSLPWWLPTDAIKDKIIFDMQNQLGRNVSIGSLTISWTNGIEIRNLNITRRSDYGTGQLIRIGMLKCPFAPLGLWAEKLDWLKAFDVDLFIVYKQADGKFNIAELPPSDTQIGKIEFDRARIHIIRLEDSADQEEVFDVVGWFSRDDQNGSLAWQLQAYQENSDKPTIVSQATLESLANDDKGQTSQGTFSVNNLNLTNLPLEPLLNQWLGQIPWDEDLTLDKLNGSLSCQTTFEMLDDGMIAGHGQINLKKLNITHKDKATKKQLPVIQNTDLNCSLKVQFDPATGASSVNLLHMILPGLSFSGQATYNPNPNADQTVALAIANCQIKPADLLDAVPMLRDLPFLQKFISPLNGSLSLSAEFNAYPRSENVSIALDATYLNLETSSLHKKIGQPLTLHLKTQFDRDTGRLAVSWDKTRYLSMTSTGSLIIPNRYDLPPVSHITDYTSSAGTIIKTIMQSPLLPSLRCRIDVENFTPLADSLKFPSDTMKNFLLDGPAHVQLEFLPQQQNRGLRIKLTLPSQTRCVIQTSATASDPNAIIFQKDTSSQLTLELTGTVLPDTRCLEKLKLLARHNDVDFTFGPAQLNYNGLIANQAPIDLRGSWQLNNIQSALQMLPDWQEQLRSKGIALTGNCQGTISFKQNPNIFTQLSGSLDSQMAAIEIISINDKPNETNHPIVGPQNPVVLFQKKTDQIASLAFDIKEDYAQNTITCDVTSQLGDLNLELQAMAKRLPQSDIFSRSIYLNNILFNIKTDKLETIMDFAPVLHDMSDRIIAGPCRIENLHGQTQLSGHLQRDNGFWNLLFALKATDAAFSFIPPPMLDQPSAHHIAYWSKPQGTPLLLNGDILFNFHNGFPISCLPGIDNSITSLLLQVKKLSLQAANSRLDLTASLLVDTDSDSSTDKNPTPCLSQAQVTATLQFNHDDSLADQSDALGAFYKRWGLAGQSKLKTSLSWDLSSARFSCNTAVDLTETAMQFQLDSLLPNTDNQPFAINKPPSQTLTFDFDCTGDNKTHKITINRIYAQLQQTTIEGNGVLEHVNFTDLLAGKLDNALGTAEFTVNINCPQIEQLTKWCPSLSLAQPTGHIKASLNAFTQFNPAFAVYLNPSTIEGKINWRANGIPLAVELRNMEISSSHLLIPALHLQMADNDLTIVAQLTDPILSPGDITDELRRPTGHISILAQKLDLDYLQQNLPLLLGHDSRNERITDNNIEHKLEVPQNLLNLLRRCSISGQSNIELLSFTDPKTQARLRLQQVRGDFRLADGHGRLDFKTALNGGVIDAAVTCDLEESDGTVVYQITSRDLKADESLSPIVESEFPNLFVQGYISEQYELTAQLSCLLDPLCHWSGQGTTVCTDGQLFGTGGPDWMIKVFPGLKLVEYPWKEMTNRWQRFPDGRKKNHLVFRGKIYDLYMDGISKPLRDPNEYGQFLNYLDKDLQQSREQLSKLNSGKLKLSDKKAKLLHRRVKGLQKWWQLSQTGQKLSAISADYTVGSLATFRPKEIFDKPKEFLPVPLFRSQSYIIGRHMVGTKTSHASFKK